MLIPQCLRGLSASLPLFFLCTAAPTSAQQGDHRGHHSTDPIVPKELIPPAPVLTPAEALGSFQLAPGFVIESVATEPLVEMPVALKFDPDGRMWVCELKGYMPNVDGTGEDIPQGRIVVLEDTDDDGSADKRTVFLDELLLPRALCLTNDGLLFSDHQNLFFIKRDGSKALGEPEIVDKNYSSSGNVEHKANGLLVGLDNWIYSAKSNRRYKRIQGKWVMEKTVFRGQWGLTKDNEGKLYHNTNSSLLYGDELLPNTLHGNPGAKMRLNMSQELGSNQVWPARVTPGVNRAYISSLNGYDRDTIDPKTFRLLNVTAACGPEIYRGDNFPTQNGVQAYICEPSGHLVKAVTILESKGKRTAKHTYEKSEFLTSTDERFRPVNLYTAPDGSLYVLDMYHGIIQHKTYVTSYLRNHIVSQKLDQPSNGFGRIYRVRHKSTPRTPAPRLSQATPDELLAHLGHKNGWWKQAASPNRPMPLKAALQIFAIITLTLCSPAQSPPLTHQKEPPYECSNYPS